MATPNQLPAKSPVLEKYRSRLQITYRTNISGTPVPSKLPFRVLVLGEFLGRDQRMVEQTDLRTRKILSIEMGSANASVAAFMKERTPYMRLPRALRKDLESSVVGSVKVESLSFPVPNGAGNDSKPQPLTVNVVGKVSFSSRVEQNGVCAIPPTQLSVTGTMSGTLTAGQFTPDSKAQTNLKITGAVQGTILDSGTKRPAGVLTALFAADEARVDFKVDNSLLSIDTGESQSLIKFKDQTKNVADVRAVRTIPFQNLSAFSPDAVAANVPELHRLAVIRSLLLELQSTLRNNRTFAKHMKDALGSKDAVLAFKKYADANYPTLKIEAKTEPGK